ncbi:hypothetical protein C1645_820669 [Glomus cerebriforme]|uniref:Uncharacterized protein n=1 Tax=Glomus cerebriforme TaxID=658196 RepID=A0A397T2H3_9GLOM|nr:hypothetical protein C1645_820669 [Glomus cerebriforme]
MANNPETLVQLYRLFLYKKKNIIAIQEKLSIGENTNQLAMPPDFELMGKTLTDSYELLLELENLNIDGNPVLEMELRRDKASSDKPIRLFDLLLSLEDDIVFEKFHDPLEDVPSVLIQRFIDKGVKMFYFTGEGLPLFSKVTPHQLHEIFVKNSAGRKKSSELMITAPD